MDVRLSGGGVGALRIQPHTIQLTDFQKPVQYIVIPLKFTGPARDVIKLIDSPPLGYAKAIGLKAEDGEGRVEGTLNMRLPLLNALLMKDVELSAEAKISDFASKKLVPGLELSQGQLALNLDKKGFTLNGPTALNKVPMQINWQYRFGAEESAPDNPRMQATVAGNVTGEQWTQLGLDFTEKQKGPAAVALRYAQTGPATSQLSGDINFRQAALNIAELGWKKAVNVPANLSFAADIPEGKNINVKTISLQGQGIRAKGTAKLDGKTMQLLALDFQPLVVGRTNANLHFTQSFGPRGSLSLAADGESFDISGLSGDKKPAEADTRPKDYAIKLKKLHTSEDGFIANVMGHARRDKEGWVEIDLHGLADGSHPLDIILQQRGEKRIFGITCDDFGKALKGMGFTDTVRDGELEIKGESTPENPRMIEGQAKVGHFVVSGLPVLMRLLSAVSPFGFVDLITGNTSFDHMEGGFRWHGETIELVKMRAAGSVFGINVEGKVDLGNGNANLHGTLVPFSFFNSVINVIPLLGNVITGGEGQGVIAASYNVDGPLSDPSISVNPVSLLTPGFLRNLFFAEDEEKKPEAAPAAP
ncbi:MAG: hypothetical protein HGA90_03970 [Alphaproteobacteria bacterium]|nr:hypothetical protein [Alphaproteobacteria bacterium]